LARVDGASGSDSTGGVVRRRKFFLGMGDRKDLEFGVTILATGAGVVLEDDEGESCGCCGTGSSSIGAVDVRNFSCVSKSSRILFIFAVLPPFPCSEEEGPGLEEPGSEDPWREDPCMEERDSSSVTVEW